MAQATSLFTTSPSRFHNHADPALAGSRRSFKRLMVSPADRIRLQDVLAAEVAKALLASPDLAPPAQWDLEMAKTYAGRYESATEALASAAGVLGRWGEGRDLEIVADVIRALEAQAAQVTRTPEGIGIIAAPSTPPTPARAAPPRKS